MTKSKGGAKKNLKTIKAKAWSIFSRYIRMKYADENGYTNCVTCGANKHWKDLQAGHFVAGRNNSILFYEKGVHPQCRRCNYNEGNGVEYFIFMEKTYGREEIDYQRWLRQQTMKRSYDDYEQLFIKYSELLETFG